MVDYRTFRLGEYKDNFLTFIRPIFRRRESRIALYVVMFYVIMAIVGPYLPLADPYEVQYAASGEVAKLHSPSLEFPLGTTSTGYSVLSQLVLAYRTSLLVGLGTATLVVFIGANIGLIAGYYGGRIDSSLMTFTDLIYGLPLLPFAIIFVAMVGSSTLSITVTIGVIVWRTIARVTRSETLSLKEREYIKNARAIGSSDVKIMYGHILPNLVPLIVLYFVFGTTWGVLIEASLSFIGLGDPNAISWGLMLYDVFTQAVFTRAWWWVLAPALSLWLFIFALFVLTRTLENNIDHTSGRI